MKPTALLLLAVLLTVEFGLAKEAPSPRERISFNEGWLFKKEDPEGVGDQLAYPKIKDAVLASSAGFTQRTQPKMAAFANTGKDVPYIKPKYDDKEWRRLSLPHDWGIEGPFNQDYPGETGKLPWWGVGWYRKHFDVPASDKGRQVYLDIDGAMSYSAVWLNGKFVGGWPYGYASYRLDLTPFISPGGKNVLAIRLDNPKESSRWYPGGGIYRNVWLVKTAPIHIGQWGTYVTTPEVSKEAATIKVRAYIQSSAKTEASVAVTTDIYETDANGTRSDSPIASLTQDAVSVAGETTETEATIHITSPKLWRLEKPVLYSAVTTLMPKGKGAKRAEAGDTYETPFGIRIIQFTTDNGFLLNGERVRINGVCNHHDLGALGAAINTRALERQIEILKEMGCNAIRTSHNPPAPELLDLCDRMGILVMDEFADTWKAPKKRNGYALLFDDWAEKDLRSFMRRDRNHPCVILWSTGNEIGEQGKPEGHEISRQLTAVVHEEDLTRPATVGCNNTQAGYNGFQKTLDVFGYNYKPGEYQKFRAANPELPLFGSETASCISSRGEYFFPVTEDKAGGKSDFQMSSYDLYAPRWATPPDREFKGQDESPFVAGEFVWTGFDYLGEPTPYNADVTNLLNYQTPEAKAVAEKELQELGKIRVPSRSSYFGIVDLAGFKKDRFYLYQARWRPDFPMAHILPHWTWPGREGEITPVHVYTSGDEAELFLNGQSLGRKQKQPFEYRFRWDDVKYQPGELKVVTYKAGKPWAEEIVKTAGPAAKIALTADRTTLRADGQDLAFITAKITDAEGTLVPRADYELTFEVMGTGSVVATDNGDATSHAPFQTNRKPVYNGLCLMILSAHTGDSNTLSVRASSEGMESGGVEVTIHRGAPPRRP